MIGTRLVEELVQSVALSHRVKGHKRCSLLLLAAPESGKTTITTAAHAKHVCRIAMITGRSILKEVKDNRETEFLLFNDLTAVRAMSPSAAALMVVLLNQLTQDERGIVAFAGKETEHITRSVGIIACLPFETFRDHRAKWKELGFVSRMIPFAYSYNAELVAEIKNAIDKEQSDHTRKPRRKFPRVAARPIAVHCADRHVFVIRTLADNRARELGQLGIRLLHNYHSVTRAHALLFGRSRVTDDDIDFLRQLDRYVSITVCQPLTERREHGETSRGTGTGKQQRHESVSQGERHRRQGRRAENQRLGQRAAGKVRTANRDGSAPRAHRKNV
jgi:hypothetical protein